MTSSDQHVAPRGSARDRPQLAAFTAQLGFSLDGFQRRACAALDDGHGVLVCAPTGAGKTVVGEFAAHLALAQGSKCFYTTPIKALSNQKYADLVAVHGHEAIGLLTGDTSINPDAPVVVMTTEVVRNMIYAQSSALIGLSHVVMDEVHFLADRFRGAVWEEVILHLPPEVKVVSLSATVSNAEEFGDWITTVRGDTTVVVDDHRPVPLSQHMLVHSRMFDLFDQQQSAKPRVNPELTRYIKARELAAEHDQMFTPRGRRGISSGERRRPRGGVPMVSRPDLIRRLEQEGLLPAITFIFSRAGCDAALDQCVRSGLSLLTPSEATRVTDIAENNMAELSESDRDVLRVDRWVSALQRGFASHHAGLLPAFRHTVEQLFVQGLVKAVFATETLALGINMPARSVVLERLVKYNGEAHVDLTPGEFTQLTGRAGRRGIDTEGHAVVVWTPDLDPDAVAGLAGARTFPLRSSFAPAYNMAVNLVGRVGISGAKTLLERSFAQFQTDRSVVGQHRKIDRARQSLHRLDTEFSTQAQAAGVDVGPADSDSHDGLRGYMRLREQLRTAERSAKFDRRLARQESTAEELFALKRGHVIALHGGRHRGLAVVIERANDKRDPKPLVLSIDAWCGRVGARDFLNAPQVLGDMRISAHADHRSGRGRRDIASALRSTGIEAPRGRQAKQDRGSDDIAVTSIRAQLRAHPAHQLTGAHDLFRLGEQRNRAERELEAMVSAVTEKTSTLVVTFDRVVAVLTELGYLTTDSADDGGIAVTITDDGRRLARVYSESDLLICECLRAEVWASLTPAELAAAVSAVVYESRRDSYAGADLAMSVPTVREALVRTHRIWRQVTAREQRHNISTTREPDAGLALAMYTWASGRTLSEALAVAGDGGRPLPAGDFVRWTRQVIDLLEQIRLSSDDAELTAQARHAARAITRGVVAVDMA